LSLFTLFDATFPTYNRVNLPKVNPFVSYDDKKFKERFRLSKRVVERLLDEVSDNQTTLFYILSSNSFIPPVCPQTKVTQSGDSRQATLAHVSLRCAALRCARARSGSPMFTNNRGRGTTRASNLLLRFIITIAK